VFSNLIIILMLVVILVPGVVLLAIGRFGQEERPSNVRPAESDLPELLRRPLRAGHNS
jgi:hypothetical protein